MSILKKVPDEFQLPIPHFSYDAPYLEFTLFRTGNILENLIGPNKFKELNKEEKEGLLHLYNVKSISKSEYAKYLGINAKTAQRHLSKFKQLDLVYTKGSTNNLRYFIKF